MSRFPLKSLFFNCLAVTPPSIPAKNAANLRFRVDCQGFCENHGIEVLLIIR